MTIGTLKDRSRRVLLLLASGIALFAVAGCDLFGDGRVAIPTSVISMVPPSGYQLSERFPGLEDTSVDGSFTVNVFPVQATRSLSELFGSVERATPTLNNRGITVEGTETLNWEGQDILLFFGTQPSDGVVYEKWIGVFVKERPVMVAFQEPQPGKLDRAAIIKAFASVTFNEGDKVNPR